MNPTGRAAIILTVYERPQYLAQALRSIREQTFEDWVCVAVDDGSTVHRDEIEAIADAEADPRIDWHWLGTTLEQREAGVRYAAVINDAVGWCESEFVRYLAHDDWLMPDCLEREVRTFDAGAEAVYGTQECIDESGGVFLTRFAADPVTEWALGRVDHNQFATTREVVERVGGWPTDPQYWRTADGVWLNRYLSTEGTALVPVPDHQRPTTVKRYVSDSVDLRVRQGQTPWL